MTLESQITEIHQDIKTLLVGMGKMETEVLNLKDKLYGQGQDDGDIPQIGHQMRSLNGRITESARRITRIEIILAGLIVSAGGFAGLTRLLG